MPRTIDGSKCSFSSRSFTRVTFVSMGKTVLFMPSSIETRNWCFSVIILSHIAKSFLSDAALAASFSAIAMGDVAFVI